MMRADKKITLRPGMDKSKCRGCGADILWAFTESGKKIPLDIKSECRLVPIALDQVGDGVLTHIGVGNSVQSVDTYISHFATCPAAKDFRR